MRPTPASVDTLHAPRSKLRSAQSIPVHLKSIGSTNLASKQERGDLTVATRELSNQVEDGGLHRERVAGCTLEAACDC